MITDELARAINNISPGMNILQVGALLQEALAGSGSAAPVGVGTTFYLDPTNGADANDGLTPAKAVKTLAAGYALLTDGANDQLVYLPGTSGVVLSDGFEWAKDSAHFIGYCPSKMAGHRTAISQASAATGVASLFKVSGNDCLFKNISFNQAVNDATSLVCVENEGSGNSFEYCEFAGIGHAAMDVPGAASLKITGGDAISVRRCKIGSGVNMLTDDSFDLVLTDGAKDVTLDNCTFILQSNVETRSVVSFEGSDPVHGVCTFRDCIFTVTTEFGSPPFPRYLMAGEISAGLVFVKDSTFSLPASSGLDWYDDSVNSHRFAVYGAVAMAGVPTVGFAQTYGAFE